MAHLRTYYQLTKPGIVYGNVFHAVAGVFFAHRYGLDLWSITGLVIGIGAVIASACVVNNLLDRSIDARMERTKKRALVTGGVDASSAVLFACILLTIGVVVMVQMTNWLALLLALIAYVWYVVIYGWAKRTTWLSTLVGSIPGALPIMVGYVAIAGHLDMTAWLLGAMLVAWQMPHFYAISLYRASEYREAGLPVASVVLGRDNVYMQMVFYGLVYMLTIILLGATKGVSWPVVLIMLGAALWWIVTIIRGKQRHDDKWARRVFRQSLVLTIVLMVASVLGVVLP